MTVGNVVAVAQSNLKRMLAYSSIAHVGYMLVGLVAGGPAGTGVVLFYLLAYAFTTAGTFGVITVCERAGHEAVDVADYSGLGRRSPLLALVLSLFLLSLVGIPPLAGFMGKFYVFGSAVRAGYLWLAVIAVLNSAVAAYYYLRVIVYMYMREPEETGAAYVPSFAGALALAIALIEVVVLGLMPAPFADLAQAAAAPPGLLATERRGSRLLDGRWRDGGSGARNVRPRQQTLGPWRRFSSPPPRPSTACSSSAPPARAEASTAVEIRPRKWRLPPRGGKRPCPHRVECGHGGRHERAQRRDSRAQVETQRVRP